MFLIINDSKLEVKPGVPTLTEMQNLVGIPDEPAYIEIVGNQFSDPCIDLVCDDEFLLKRCQPTCCTSTRQIIHGQVLAVGVNLNNAETIELTETQVEIVKRELMIATNLLGFFILSPASQFFKK